MLGRRKGEDDRSAFPGSLKSSELRGKMGGITDLAKI